ncbi:MAG TPA: PP2C family protein-serine/threonine phosphatase [Thermoanaerobaculia bacterium]|nr:PP2C family protein-serine/threonine phosphatase [Thermoanaerobaculia bacterium]
MDYKTLLTQVQRTIDSLEIPGDPRGTITRISETIVRNFRDQLGITGGRLYELGDEGYELVARFGKSNKEPLGIQVPLEYRPIELVRENGIVVMDPSDPGFDPVLEKKLGANRFAAITVGDEGHILSFNVSRESSRDDILFSLNLIRYSINQKLRAQRYESIIAEAQRIQQSILPQRIPPFEGYEMHARSVSAEVVSGDFYDFIPISNNVLGVAIADASGHGLPAALMARDIYVGLRMGTGRDFKIIRTLEKLNQIIHRGRLTTKFVSLFYGELESGGVLIYSNAGHNPPFIVKRNRIELLRSGGTVLGPTPDATYTRGYVRMEAGDILCLYTDGVVEARDTKGMEFGLERLERVIRANRQKSTQEIVQAVFQRLDRWSKMVEDDRTLVAVKATASS